MNVRRFVRKHLFFSVCLVVATLSHLPESRADFLSKFLGIGSSKPVDKGELDVEFDKSYFKGVNFESFDAVSSDLPQLNSQIENFDPELSWQNFAEGLLKDKKESGLEIESGRAMDIFSQLGSWETIKNLNFLAKSLWDQLVNCNNGDLQATRVNYFGGNLCGDQGNSKELKREIVLLHKNVFNLIKTGSFFIPRAGKRGPTPQGMFGHILRNLNLSMAGKPTDLSYWDNKIGEWRFVNSIQTPLFHPLFTQIVIENLTVIVRIVNGSYQSVFRVRHPFREILLDYNFSNFTTVLRTSEIAYWNELKEKNLLDEASTYTTAKLYLNSWLLFAMVAKDSCSQIGLWPEFSFSLIQLFYDQHADFSREMARVISEVKCEVRPEIKSEWANFPFNLNEVEIVLAYRKMANQYGIELFKEHKCIFGRLSDLTAPNKYKCFTFDPYAPDDIDTGLAQARGNFHPKVPRVLKSLNYIGSQ